MPTCLPVPGREDVYVSAEESAVIAQSSERTTAAVGTPGVVERTGGEGGPHGMIDGQARPVPYDGQHPFEQLGREVVIRGTFDGPGVQTDYVDTAGEPVYLEREFFKTAAPPAYGSQVEVRGVLKFWAFRPGRYQHPPGYYNIDRGALKVLRPARDAS